MNGVGIALVRASFPDRSGVVSGNRREHRFQALIGSGRDDARDIAAFLHSASSQISEAVACICAGALHRGHNYCSNKIMSGFLAWVMGSAAGCTVSLNSQAILCWSSCRCKGWKSGIGVGIANRAL